MTEPRRLIEDGATHVERALLDAARADRPPRDAAPQILAALQTLVPHATGPDLPIHGHEPAAAPGHAVVAPGKVAALATWAKIGLLGLGICGAAAVARSVVNRRSVSVAPPPVYAPAPTVEQAPVAPTAEAAPAGDDAEAPTASESRGAFRERGTIPTDRSLAAEIRVLNGVREALDAHQPAIAVRALEGYRRNYPYGHLKPEATVLRLSALIQQGNYAAARSLAARLLADASYKTYEFRIRSLLRQTEK